MSSLKNKDLITTLDWSDQELMQVINLAAKVKLDPQNPKWRNCLNSKTFLMLFCNPSLRTHISFETATVELGGYPLYREPSMGWIKKLGENTSGESIKDAARVMSRYVHGIGIRQTLKAVNFYGQGNETLREYAKWADVPIINMADDKFHPCQGLADLMGWSEKIGEGYGKPDINNLKGKKLLLTWGKSGLARPWSAVQSHLLLAARFGMNVTLAYPDGYDLDEQICQQAKNYCTQQGTHFEIINDAESGYQNAEESFAI